MSLSDPIASMLVKIKNACLVEKTTVDINHSKINSTIINILKNEGFVETYKEVELGNNKKKLEVTLKYTKNSASTIKGVKRISTPGRRVYSDFKNMPQVLNGYGILIISTSKGVMTGKEALKQKVGGELICSIW